MDNLAVQAVGIVCICVLVLLRFTPYLRSITMIPTLYGRSRSDQAVRKSFLYTCHLPRIQRAGCTGSPRFFYYPHWSLKAALRRSAQYLQSSSRPPDIKQRQLELISLILHPLWCLFLSSTTEIAKPDIPSSFSSTMASYASSMENLL